MPFHFPSTKGSRSPTAKLSEADVEQIRRLYSVRPPGQTQKQFCQDRATIYGVAWQTIRGVVQQRTWR